METKQAIRKQIREIKKTMPRPLLEQWSREITEAVTALPEFGSARRILAYVNYNQEVITRYLIEEAWKREKQVAVPRCIGNEMHFFPITDFDQLRPGTMGIPEPFEGEAVSWEEALMIMPGVAFDTDRHRIGYGGGYYDRYLEKHPGLTTVAVCYAFQILAEVPAGPLDVVPSRIVTEQGIIV